MLAVTRGGLEKFACLCSLGSSRGCRCPQKCQCPAELASEEGKQCLQECQGPAEKAAPEGNRALTGKHPEAEAAAWCGGGHGGIASPMPPPHCSLQDLPVEMQVEIFASIPGTDLARLAQASTKFRHVVQHVHGLWAGPCREEYDVPENLPSREGSLLQSLFEDVPIQTHLGIVAARSSLPISAECSSGWLVHH